MVRLERIPSGIETLELADPRDSFPLLFRQLFSRLEATGTKVVQRPDEPDQLSSADPASDLAHAKAALAAGQLGRTEGISEPDRGASAVPGTAPSRSAVGHARELTPGGAVTKADAADRAGAEATDATFLRLEARSVHEAAEATAALLHSLLAQNAAPLSSLSSPSSSSSSSASSSPPSSSSLLPSSSLLLIRDGDPRTHAILDSALRRHGLAVPGLRLSSTHRPACQVLPLFLQLSWEPVDTALLVQFLQLSVSPVPGSVRWRLLRAVREAPGYGSKEWHEARDKAIASLRDRYGHEAAERAATALQQWIDDVPRIPDGTRVPVIQVMDRTRQVAEWLNRMAHAGDEPDPTFRIAHRQAQLLLELLDLHPAPDLLRLELEGLLREVTATGTETVAFPRQAGALRVVGSPAAVLEEASTVVWWQCVGASVPREPRPFWSDEEVAWLSQRGVELHSPRERLLHRARELARPVLAARDRVILVQPQHVFGERQESHPIWDQIVARIAPDRAAQRRLTLDAEELLRADGPLAPLVRERPVESLPAPARLLCTSHRPIRLREQESPSSLERLLSCPLRWGLSYGASLWPRDLAVIPTGPLFLGTVAHRVVESVLGEHLDAELPVPEEVEERIGLRFDALLPQVAAPLLRPEREAERGQVRATLVRSTGELVRLLRLGDYRIATIEKAHDKPLGDGRLGGRTDLVLRRQRDGLVAVVDLKWAGKTNKLRALREGTALQLAAYSHLLREGDAGGWPPTAYFLFPSRQLLSTRPAEFPGCQRVDGPDEGAVWARVVRSLDAVRERLARGEVEVPFLTAEDRKGFSGFGDDGIAIPAPCRYCEYQLLCGAEEIE
jgi:hypothetical protein